MESISMSSPPEEVLASWNSHHAAGTMSQLVVRDFWKTVVPEIFAPEVSLFIY